MKTICLFSLLLVTYSCNAQKEKKQPVTKPGVVIPPTDSAIYKMPVKEPATDTSMNMPVVPMKPGLVPR